MLFLLCIVLLAMLTASLPYLIPWLKWLFPNVTIHSAPRWLPVLAGLLMVISVLLPNIHISSETTTFQQHFVGGGLYTACLYLYAKQLFAWRVQWAVDLLALFAWVSAFGVLNKLIEFAFLKLGLAAITTSDTDWDLLANTLGGFVGYACLAYGFRIKKP